MFWKMRYRLARLLIHTGIFVMPKGRYKEQLLARLWELYDQVVAEVEHRRKAKETLKNHKGVLLGLTPEQHRAIAEMDPGPTASIGRKPA